MANSEVSLDFHQLASGRPETLNDKDAKTLLRSYGVPVVEELFATDENAAVEAAQRIGYPVVVKGQGEKLLHKTEAGAVRLNLESPSDVRKAAAAIRKSAGHALEGFAVQPQLNGRRELVIGMFRDREFGPVVMVGWGGIFTESLGDRTFRLAPLKRSDIEAMLDEIRVSRTLGCFRGESPVNRNDLIRIILSVSRLSMDHPEIGEVDINPLLVLQNGRLVAVDTLVIRTPTAVNRHSPTQPAISPEMIGALFHPKSVAFIGVSAQFGKWGHMLVSNTIGGGFSGALHLVNPKGGTLFGKPVYRSVTEIPESVDLAVVTIPAAMVPELIPDLRQKNITNIVMITSGFGETGAVGKHRENELVRRAQEAGMLILGPNTMGICNPHVRFYCTGSPVFPQAGTAAVVAQSGNMGTQLLAFAEQQGIGIRGFAGSGNEAMLTVEDYLDGFEADPLTRIVMLYVESVKNGRRFFESAKRVGRQKPVVLLKGGQSPEGNRAASSHTGAMVTDAAVFDAMCRQAGIVKVDLPMELLDLSAAFSALPLPEGNRVAIMTLGGGWGVVTADLCARHGLSVPELSGRIVRSLDPWLPPYWSRSNPLDLVGESDLELPLTVMEALLEWDGCDAVVHLGILGKRIFVSRLAASVGVADPDVSASELDGIQSTLEDFENRYIAKTARLMERYQKPVVGVRLLTAPDDRTIYDVDGCKYKTVFYETPERAVRALAKMTEYRRFLRREAEADDNSLPGISDSAT